eukprot:TRINITY_DN49149_c0_g1_i1.p1 TRINITY_DN49149_c0_g1~~TRINITY_DN49149_c0_g1_i1.p1  ORF type:complete len:286 (-),score=59.36 TRINITY_DN49149_c0_g1_i1:66-854(-)
MTSVAELEADLRELKSMLEDAKRPNVRQELQRVLDLTQIELKRLQDAASVRDRGTSDKEADKSAAGGSSPQQAPAKPPVAVDVRSAGPWTEITTFALDLGGYNKPSVTIDIRMKGVEALQQEAVTCDFTESSFDLKIMGFEGSNHRMIKTNLDKDIVPKESSVRVKKNHVIVTLQKVKGEYSYDSWTDLCAKGGKRRAAAKAGADPQSSIVDLMKDLYDDGDDNMKKIIGEAMLKSRRGETHDPKDDDLLTTPSMSDGLGDM